MRKVVVTSVAIAACIGGSVATTQAAKPPPPPTLVRYLTGDGADVAPAQLIAGAEGALGVILGDGSVLAFGPHSELTLDDYRFAPALDELRLRATLNRGTLNLIAGDMARLDPQAIAVDTPDGRIGVRGGQVLMKVSP